MKVLILGPVVNEVLSGGVGVFDEGLFKGFNDLGDNVNIVSVSKSSSIDNIIVLKKPSNNTKHIYFSFGKIAKIIKENQPDLVISSLQYSLGIKKYKKCWSKATYVAVLHGVPWNRNGKIKAWCVNQVAKYSKKYFDKVVTVSFLSYALNKQMNSLVCDKVIHNGCLLNMTENNKNRVYDIVYVGRLHKDKEIEMIADAFVELLKNNSNLKLAIAGYGDLENLFKTGKYSKTKIEFLGRLSQSDVSNLLSKTKFFISMCPLEAFGIVYAEAAMNGCNIISPSSVGAAPIFMHQNYFHVADCCDKDELANKLHETLSNFHEIPESEKKRIEIYFSYKRCAEEYKNLVR